MKLTSRLRNALWAWWLWLGLALLALAEASWLHAAVPLVLAVISFLFPPSRHTVIHALEHEHPVDSDQFICSLTGATDKFFTEGNRIDILNNGDRFFPAMIDAIRGARTSITVEAYIFWDGEIGRRISEELCRKAREDIPVRILIDAFGTPRWKRGELPRRLRDSGCRVAWYHTLTSNLRKINHRTHRKSLIIDGKVAFTGGAGIADNWLGDAHEPGQWRDIMIRIEGPCVQTLQSGFASNWLETTDEMLVGPEIYPEYERPGTLKAATFLSSTEVGDSAVRHMYFLAIAFARKSIYVANPYFVPDHSTHLALAAADRRGVDVKVIVPARHNDSRIARHNSSRLYGRLINSGVEIYEYNRTMLHQKLIVVDGLFASIGTTNFNLRSFALNDESNVCVYDRDFAEELTRVFMNDLKDSERVTLESWRNRGLRRKAAEIGLSIFREHI